MADKVQYKIETCNCCGNKGMQKVISSYKQKQIEYDDGSPIYSSETVWSMLECPVCSQVSLHKSYSDDTMIDYQGNFFADESIVFPKGKYVYRHVPKDIMKSYEAAIKTSKVDLSVSLIAIRAVLEKICVERGTKRRNLEAMLKEMVSKNILPSTLDECSFLIRKLGNSGAHGDDSALTSGDVASLIDFIETIMYYIYELPIYIKRLKDKYDLAKQQESTETVT